MIGFTAIRRMLHASPLLHSMMLTLRGERTLFPARDDDLFLTGYPRSANSFSLNLARSTFPELRIAGYIHTHGSVRLARTFGMPVLILLRAPHDAVASLLHMQAGAADHAVLDRLARRALVHYIDYHRYVERCLYNKAGSPIRILHFDALIDRPEAVVDCVQSLPLRNLDHSVSLAERHEWLLAFMRRERVRTESRREVGYFGVHKNQPDRDVIRAVVAEQALLVDAQKRYETLSRCR